MSSAHQPALRSGVAIAGRWQGGGIVAFSPAAANHARSGFRFAALSSCRFLHRSELFMFHHRLVTRHLPVYLPEQEEVQVPLAVHRQCVWQGWWVGGKCPGWQGGWWGGGVPEMQCRAQCSAGGNRWLRVCAVLRVRR